MTTVQHTLLTATGAPIVGRVVPIRLASNGYTQSGHAEILATAYATTDATGTYTADLTPQSQIDPAGTHYEATHPGGEVLSFVVSDATGPLWVRDLLVENPATPSGVTAGMTVVDNGNGTATIS